MHPCLHVLDILGTIFKLIFEEPRTGPKTLIALACTCRTFQDIALDIIWRAIPSFTPLIQCLVPPDAWKLTKSSLVLERQTIPSDWTRLKVYTPRIRRFGFGANAYVRLAPNFALALKHHGVLPLPNVQVYRYESFPLTKPLALGPNLLELEMVYGGRANAWDFSRQLTNSLECSFPLLRKFTMESKPDIPSDLPKVLTSSFASLFASLNRLEVLSIVDFTLPDDALRMLCSSHIIRCSKSNNTSGAFLRCLPSYGPILPKLEVFSFHTGDMSESSDLICRLVPQRLQSIAVVHDDRIAKLPLVEYRARDFFRALKIHCASAVLTSIVLHHRNPSFDYENQKDLICTMRTFEPLLSFQNLREFDLFLYGANYELHDSSLERMTTAWPQMRCFRLKFESHWALEAQSDITLEGLLSVAKNWPQLEHLSLTFNTGTLNDIPLLKPGAGSCCPHLQSIDVGYSILHDRDPELWGVAAFLTAIFPNLHNVDYQDETGDWWFVSSVVEAMGKVRKQERAHAYAEWTAKNG